MKGIYCFLFVVSILASCRKDTTESPLPVVTSGNLNITMAYRFDSSMLQTDTIKYKNAAGYKMSITRLQYYLSNFKFLNSDGSTYSFNQVCYLDAKDPNFSNIKFIGVPLGNYKGLSFTIGLDTSINKTYYLPATVENNNMEWPPAMGGGYHFMKLEGYFVDTSGTWGYNMHLGSNGTAVAVSLANKPFSITETTSNIQLKMNISEWFKNPSVYDFNIDGVFSMGNMAAMLKLKNNGSDVFKD